MIQRCSLRDWRGLARQHFGFKAEQVHIDTTSFSVNGDYLPEEKMSKEPLDEEKTGKDLREEEKTGKDLREEEKTGKEPIEEEASQ